VVQLVLMIHVVSNQRGKWGQLRRFVSYKYGTPNHVERQASSESKGEDFGAAGSVDERKVATDTSGANKASLAAKEAFFVRVWDNDERLWRAHRPETVHDYPPPPRRESMDEVVRKRDMQGTAWPARSIACSVTHSWVGLAVRVRTTACVMFSISASDRGVLQQVQVVLL